MKREVVIRQRIQPPETIKIPLKPLFIHALRLTIRFSRERLLTMP
ncbi:TPA: hypothetical protein ACUKT1_001669 [Escherichia coli]